MYNGAVVLFSPLYMYNIAPGGPAICALFLNLQLCLVISTLAVAAACCFSSFPDVSIFYAVGLFWVSCASVMGPWFPGASHSPVRRGFLMGDTFFGTGATPAAAHPRPGLISGLSFGWGIYRVKCSTRVVFGDFILKKVGLYGLAFRTRFCVNKWVS